jgi:hypothetical protein
MLTVLIPSVGCVFAFIVVFGGFVFRVVAVLAVVLVGVLELL